MALKRGKIWANWMKGESTMTLGVNLGAAGVPDCDFQAVGETEEEVMDRAREHLGGDHRSLPNQAELLTAIQALIGPVKQ
jgi:predicted small metal-binding protein